MLHVVGYLYYWQMGFNSVFKGLSNTIRTQSKEQIKMVTLDIKDLNVNLPIQGITQTTKFWLNKNNNNRELIERTLYMLQIILKQNYFQHNEHQFQPKKKGGGIAMGYPISSTKVEVYPQYLEEKLKH